MLYLLVRTWFELNVHPGAGTSLDPSPRFSVRMTRPSASLIFLVHSGILGPVVDASGGTGTPTRTSRGYGFLRFELKASRRLNSEILARRLVKAFCGPRRGMGVAGMVDWRGQSCLRERGTRSDVSARGARGTKPRLLWSASGRATRAGRLAVGGAQCYMSQYPPALPSSRTGGAVVLRRGRDEEGTMSAPGWTTGATAAGIRGLVLQRAHEADRAGRCATRGERGRRTAAAPGRRCRASQTGARWARATRGWRRRVRRAWCVCCWVIPRGSTGSSAQSEKRPRRVERGGRRPSFLKRRRRRELPLARASCSQSLAAQSEGDDHCTELPLGATTRPARRTLSLPRSPTHSTTSALAVGLGARLESTKCASSAYSSSRPCHLPSPARSSTASVPRSRSTERREGSAHAPSSSSRQSISITVLEQLSIRLAPVLSACASAAGRLSSNERPPPFSTGSTSCAASDEMNSRMAAPCET